MRKMVLAICFMVCLLTSTAWAGTVDDVQYLDENGTEQREDGVTELSDTMTTLTSDWYLVSGDVVFSDRIAVTGHVRLILVDGAHLDAQGGIQVAQPNSLTIYAQSTDAGMGALTAGYAISLANAAIGGNAGEHGGDITINGGVVSATGVSGAGIGGGGRSIIPAGTVAGDGGNITINGGIVMATSAGGAAIGGGNNTSGTGGAGGSVTINGGVVSAMSNTRGIGGGSGNPSGANGSLSMNGNGVVFVEPPYLGDLSEIDNGILFNSNEGKDGTVYGDVTLSNDLTISADETLTVPVNAKLTVPDGVTLKNDGKIVNNGEIRVPEGGTFVEGNRTGSGTVTYDQTVALTDSEILQIAQEAYEYALPLVLMDLTEKNITNVSGDFGAPINQFYHIRHTATAQDRYIVRPNIDTPYSHAYLDLRDEPILFSKPKTDIYCSVAVFDAYTNCAAVLGTGGLDNGEAAVYALCGPDYDGPVPPGTVKISIPTNMAWILGRTEYLGDDRLAELHAIQDSLSLVPLSGYGNPGYTPPSGTYDPQRDYVPLEKLMAMDIETFFDAFNSLAVPNPGTSADKPALDRYAQIGVGPGKTFDLTAFSPEAQGTLRDCPAAVLDKLIHIGEADVAFFRYVNSWMYPADHIARYGTDYEFRAAIAVTGIGANPVSMAIYPSATVDAEGRPLDGNNRYTIRFGDGLPPCGAFWSITAYDEYGFLIDNPLDKYAIRNKDAFTQNPDGSTTFYLQPESPGAELEANWLPVPSGPFRLTLRIYLPEPSVLDFSWKPPYVVRASGDDESDSGVGCDAGAGALGALALVLLSIRRLKKSNRDQDCTKY